jgi:hypothetical protein
MGNSFRTQVRAQVLFGLLQRTQIPRHSIPTTTFQHHLESLDYVSRASLGRLGCLYALQNGVLVYES